MVKISIDNSDDGLAPARFQAINYLTLARLFMDWIHRDKIQLTPSGLKQINLHNQVSWAQPSVC